LGEIIAYLKSLPAVDNETREPQFNQAGADANRESVTPVKFVLAGRGIIIC
jgi:hypothetical protein